ncbi:MAG: Ldh family oxidoreductase [Thalassobaculales bacterium]
MPLVPLPELTELMARALAAAGTAPDTAAGVARALARAEADGIASHGAARLPVYAEQVRTGKVDGQARPVLAQGRTAALRVDAGGGFAFPAISIGLEAAVARAGETGVAALAIARSHHFGVAGHPVEDAAAHGLMALAFSNTPQAIAPWGGHRGLFGTNPIAFAAPRAGAPPLVIDLSVSQVARGKVVLAARRGEAIPLGWALDAEGRPTTDANAGLAGTMAPLGGPKGAALALMVELLCGALTGSNFGYEGTSFFEPEGAPPLVGHLILLFDPAAFHGGRDSAARTEEMIAAILAQPGARLPGDRRLAARRRAATEGVDIPAPLLADIRSRAEAGNQAAIQARSSGPPP